MYNLSVTFLTLIFCLTARLSIAQQTAADYFNEGVQKSTAKDYPGALQAFTTAIILNPENAPSYYNRALAKISLNDIQGLTWISTKLSN